MARSPFEDGFHDKDEAERELSHRTTEDDESSSGSGLLYGIGYLILAVAIEINGFTIFGLVYEAATYQQGWLGLAALVWCAIMVGVDVLLGRMVSLVGGIVLIGGMHLFFISGFDTDIWWLEIALLLGYFAFYIQAVFWAMDRFE